MSRINFVFLWLWIFPLWSSVAAGTTPVIRASDIGTFRNIRPQTSWCVDHDNQPGFASLPPVRFRSDASDTSSTLHPPVSDVFYPHYFRFAVFNDLPDTAAFYFYADMQEQMQLRQEKNGKQTFLSPQNYEGRVTTGTEVFLLVIPPGQTIQYITKIIPLKSQLAEITPALIHPAQVATFFARNYQNTQWEILQINVFCGMLLMMLLYIFFKYIQARSKEYLYYAGYIFCFLVYFFLKSNAFNTISIYHYPFCSFYLVNHSQVWGYCLYFAFFRQFLNVAVTLPRLNRMLRWATGILLVYSAADLLLFFFPSAYPLRWMLWDIIRTSLILFSVVALFVIIRLKNKLMHYIFAGSISVSAFGLLAMVFSVQYQIIENWAAPFDSPLFYFQLGITIELLCFSLGLGYKNHRDEVEKVEATEALKYERDRQAFERYKAAVEAREAERRRIATEMHDDIGSGLTSILFLSNAIHRHAHNGQAEATEKIAGMASGLVDKMNNIIWSMNKEYDTLQDLIAYVRSHISELLENADLSYRFDIQEPVPELMLNGEQRRNLYLVVNEAVHNIIKHAHATCVTLHFQYDTRLFIRISDDGVGLTGKNGRRFGNGLKNMRQRIQDIGGTIDFGSAPGEGTTVSITVDCLVHQPGNGEQPMDG